MKLFYKVLFVIALVCSVLLCGCKKNENEVIVFDNTHPLAIAPNIEWAVVNDPYAAYRKESNWDSAVSGHCRKGDILQIYGKSIDAQKDSWFLFESGWLPANCLSVYSNRLKAKSASEALVGSER